jgi:hypothetical protein
MDIFTIYTGSEGQTISQQIKQDGRPFDLTTSTVKFFLRHAASDVLKVNDEAATVNILVGGRLYNLIPQKLTVMNF